MIGIKSVIAVGLAAMTVAVGLWRGVFNAEQFAHLSAAAAFAVGLFASLCAALVGFGWRPRRPSRTAIAVRGGRPTIIDEAASPRELPALAQRGLLVVVFATIALGTLGNHAAARIANVPTDLTTPSRSEYCLPDDDADDELEPEPIVEVQQVDQAGCALVKRAFALGYAKTLGSCAPRTITRAPTPKIAREREVCTRRQLDEPFLHYAYRRVVETTSDISVVDSIGERVHGVRTRVGYVGDLIADIRHAVTGTPHASHHLWVDLPDPHAHSWTQLFTGEISCMTTFAELALWPRWTQATAPGQVFQHVLGQLLFASRFGTPASCSDYTIHWGAPVDACTRLAADPTGFLAEADALEPVRAVLDRRRRQLAVRAMAAAVGEPSTIAEPPAARAVTSVACLMFDGARPAVGTTITIDGEPILMRELHAPAIRADGAGPIAVYTALYELLAGTSYAGAASGTQIDGPLADDSPPSPSDDPPASSEPSPTAPAAPRPSAPSPPRDPDFPLLQLEPLLAADPFLGDTTPLDRQDVAEVYPIEHHLSAFVDAFRRIYTPQRGRL